MSCFDAYQNLNIVQNLLCTMMYAAHDKLGITGCIARVLHLLIVTNASLDPL